MGLFTKRQNDRTWSKEFQTLYHEAKTLILGLDQALQNSSYDDLSVLVPRVREDFPQLHKSIKQIRSPYSPQAQVAHKSFKSALKNYINSAKQGEIFLKDLTSGPGQRLVNETGFAKRAAAGRLAFSESAFRSFADSGIQDFLRVAQFLGDTVD